MISSKWILSSALLGALSLAGCSKEAPEPADEETVTQPSAPPAVAPTPPPEPTAVKVPLSPATPKTQPSGVVTPEDLEEEAAGSVQLDNLEAELDRLEAEISGGG